MADEGPATQFDKPDESLDPQGKFKISKRILISIAESC